MASDTQKLRLEFALVNNPDFKKVADEDHWIYIPRELQEAVASASQEMEPGTIAEMMGRDISILERWLEEYKHVTGLKDRVLESKRIKDPMTPYDPTTKPDVCKLAQITSVWMTSKAIDLPRRTIKDWMEKGWGKIDLTDEDGNDIPLAPKYV